MIKELFLLYLIKITSLIGTTEVEVKKPEDNNIENNEIDYLIQSCINYLKKPISHNDIISSYSGIRPLIEDFNLNASKVTRDYTFDLNIDNGFAPVISYMEGN